MENTHEAVQAFSGREEHKMDYSAVILKNR